MKKEKKEPMHYELAEWFYGLPESRVVSHQEVRHKIDEIRRKRGLDSKKTMGSDIHRWVSQCRKYLVRKHGILVDNRPMEGFKIANPREYTFFAMKRVRQTILSAEWAKELAPHVDRRYIPEAVERVFIKTQSGVKSLVQEGLKFVQAWNSHLKQQRQIEAKKEDGKA